MSDWKTKRKEILDNLNENLQKRADVAEQKGFGKLGAGVAAGLSAAAELMPESATDAAMMAVPGVGIAKKAGSLLKRLRGLKKSRSARKAAAAEKEDFYSGKSLKDTIKEGRAKRASEVESPEMIDEDSFKQGYRRLQQKKSDKKLGK